MKAASPTLLSLLALRQFLAADLYHFALVGGTLFNYYGGNAGAQWNYLVEQI
jgi:hypothetical protein